MKRYEIKIKTRALVGYALYELQAWKIDPLLYTVDTDTDTLVTKSTNVVDVITESLPVGAYTITKAGDTGGA